MAGREEVPIDAFVVRTPEELRVIADPLRLRLLALLREEPRTVKELAATLDVPPTRLYYHINQLEQHGFIIVAETRLVSGIVEKRYRAAAPRLSIDRSLLAPPGQPGDPALEAMLAAILDGTRDSVIQSVRAGLVNSAVESIHEHGLLLGRRWLRLSPEQAAEFYDRLVALVHEYAETEPSPGAEPYELLLGLHRTTSTEDDDG